MFNLNSALPIYSVLESLIKALESSPQVVLQAEPGAGKSTQVPLAVLQSPIFQAQKVLMLEPRRIAAKRLADYLAKQFEEPVGQTIGFRVRNETKVTAQTRLEIVTEGVLTRMLQSDPELNGYGLVIFDEFHERSLHADLGLTLLQEVQGALREDLRCLVMSATLNHQALGDYWPDAPVIQSQGRAYPVSVSYHPAPLNTPLYAQPQLASVLKQALQESCGDVLIFLAGQGEIHRAMQACESLCRAAKAESLPLYGQLKPSQQAQVFAKNPRRKVIFSTNIAQTSLTLEGITAVIDSGLEKVNCYDPNVGMSRLQLQRISKASAEQRMGRAGRVQAGHCYRLWSESQQQSLESHDAPEILNADLSGLRMELSLWGAHADELHWLDAPPKPHLAAAETVLQQLGFLTQQGRLHSEGSKALRLHSEPRFAKILQCAQEKDCLALGCDCVALLQEGDLLKSAETVDFAWRLEAFWQALAEPENKRLLNRFNRGVWQNAKRNRQRLYQRFDLNVKRVSLAQQQANKIGMGELLVHAFTDRVGQLRRSSSTEVLYKLSNGRGVALPSTESIKSSFIVALEVDAQAQQGRVFSAVSVSETTIKQDLPLTYHIEVYFDAQKAKVRVEKQCFLAALKVGAEACLPEEVDAAQVQNCLLAQVQQDLSQLPWSKAAQSLQSRAEWLGQFEGFEVFRRLSLSHLQASMDWLAPYTLHMNSMAQLQALNLTEILQSLLDYSALQQLNQEAPSSYQSPGGKTFDICYSAQQAKVSLPLQQVLGELRSPSLAGGQVALTFELLSPARRPIQVTNDLANFWTSSYFEVAKEMRGRYPKHRWPEEPLKEKAGASIKKRSP